MPRQRRDVPWLDQRDNGIWYAFWYDAKASRTCRESMETRDAGEAARQFGAFLTAGPKSTRHVGDAGVTAEQALDWYDREHVEPNVVDKQRQRDAMAHLKAFFAKDPLRDIDVNRTRTYADMRRAGKIGGGSRQPDKRGSSSTIRRELVVLVAAANHAVRFHRDAVTAADLPQVEFPPETKHKAPWLTKQAVRLVFEKAEGDLRDFCVLAYYWAPRRKSVERLGKAQVDLKHSRVDLNPPGRAQTKKRRPIVPIYPEVRPIVERLMNASETPYLFGTPRDFYRDFVALCRDNGIYAQDMPEGKDPWPHLLRHSRATHMLMDGEDPYKVAKLLGDTLATVERVYGHHNAEYLKTHSTVEEVA